MKKKPMPQVNRNDGWSSLITGLGTSADKRLTNSVQWEQRNREFYEQLYAGDELAGRIVDIVPEDALRKGWECLGYEKPILKKVEDRADALDMRGAMERTWKWARAYGGALLYIVTDTVDPSKPLNPLNEKVLALRDISLYDLRILTTDIETDFGSDNYGCPNIYYLNVQIGTNVKLYPIHWTRCIRFDGKIVPRRTYIRNNYWHDSILQKLYNVIRNYQTSNDAAASILQDFNVGVFKMKNLANMMSAGNENMVKQRIEMVNFSKSVIKAVVLDADDEDFIDLSRNVSGLADMLEHQAKRFVAATDIPHTKLLGESPDGSNATGNSTTQMWYEYVESEQNNYLRKKLRRLFDVIFYDMPELQFKFRPLAKLTDLEEAELRNKQAQTDGLYIEKGVLDPTEVADSRFGGDIYSSETKLDTEGRAAGLVVPGAQNANDPFGSDPSGDDDSGDNGDGPDSDGPQPGRKGSGESGFTGPNAPKPDQTPDFGKRDADEPKPPMPGSGPSQPKQPRPADALMQARAAQKTLEKDPESAEASSVNLPQSLQDKPLNPLGIENPKERNQWNLENNEIPTHVDKIKPFISQTMSEPFRDPKTDPLEKPPGLPNKPRQIDYAGQFSAATKMDSAESMMMPRQLDETKKKVQNSDAVKTVETPNKDLDASLPEAVAIVVTFGDKILLGKRRDNGKWTLPGGHSNPGEHPIDAALRELHEESGIQPDRDSLIPMKSHSTDGAEDRPGCQVHTFRVDVMTQAATPKNDPDKEVTLWKWFPVKLPADIQKNLQHKPNLALDDFWKELKNET